MNLSIRASRFATSSAALLCATGLPAAQIAQLVYTGHTYKPGDSAVVGIQQTKLCKLQMRLGFATNSH
jgi:hypothetical protein